MYAACIKRRNIQKDTLHFRIRIHTTLLSANTLLTAARTCWQCSFGYVAKASRSESEQDRKARCVHPAVTYSSRVEHCALTTGQTEGGRKRPSFDSRVAGSPVELHPAACNDATWWLEERLFSQSVHSSTCRSRVTPALAEQLYAWSLVEFKHKTERGSWV